MHSANCNTHRERAYHVSTKKARFFNNILANTAQRDQANCGIAPPNDHITTINIQSESTTVIASFRSYRSALLVVVTSRSLSARYSFRLYIILSSVVVVLTYNDVKLFTSHTHTTTCFPFFKQQHNSN